MAISALVFFGSALMVYNIYEFIRYARYVRGRKNLDGAERVLNIPIALLISFLVGYLVVGTFGKPDIVMAGILFGGSIFVFAMHRMLFSVTHKIVEGEQLAAELMAAERSNRVKSRFLASVSHEMRTPMNVILGLSELGLATPDLPVQTREQLTKIQLSGQHLLAIINNILDMNDLEEGRLTLKSEPFSLRGALDQISAIVQSLCDEKGLTYILQVDEAVGHGYEGDPLLVKQVIVSLLDNAVKFTDAPGKVTCSVSVASVAAHTHTVRFEVTDTGVGMDEEFLPNAFDPFVLEDASSTNRHGGSGLGLAIAKATVERMGGTIGVQSKKHVGSTFTIELPLVCLQQDAEADCEVTEDAYGLAGKHILIADDVDENAEIVSDLLELEGATSEHARTGQEALDIVSSSAPGCYDAVLMDLRMPVMDGLEATRRIRGLDRQDAKRIPIVALSANAFDSDVRESLQAGMDAHLAKPVDVDTLYETLGALMRAQSGEQKGR